MRKASEILNEMTAFPDVCKCYDKILGITE